MNTYWMGRRLHTITLTILVRHIHFFSKVIYLSPWCKTNFVLWFTKIAEFPTELLQTLFSDQELILKPQVSSKINWHVCNRTWTEFEQALEKRIPFPNYTNHHLKRFALYALHVPIFASVGCLLSPTLDHKLFSEKKKKQYSISSNLD